MVAAIDMRRIGCQGYGPPEYFSIKQVPKFVGCMLSTCLVGFMLVTFAASVCALLVTTGTFSSLLAEYWTLIAFLCIWKAILVLFVDPILLEGYLTDGTNVKRLMTRYNIHLTSICSLS